VILMVDIKSMSLEEKIGQLLVIGFDGYEYNEHLQEIIEKYKVGILSYLPVILMI